MKARFKVSKIDFGFSGRAGYLWLLGILLTVVPAFASHPAVDPDLVFCPLQKTWVKKGGANWKPTVDPLRNVCATDSAKRNFAYESFRQLSASSVVLDDRRTEDLFFGYLKVGKRAFDTVRPAPTHEQTVSGVGGSEKSAANGQIVADKKTVAAIAIEQQLVARIETTQIFFDRQAVSEFKVLRRNSCPRAPPTSL